MRLMRSCCFVLCNWPAGAKEEEEEEEEELSARNTLPIGPPRAATITSTDAPAT